MLWFVLACIANGYIEADELDDFLREFVSSVNSTDIGPEVSERACYAIC